MTDDQTLRVAVQAVRLYAESHPRPTQVTQKQAAQMLRVGDKQLWRRIEHYVSQARAKQDMRKVRLVGIDETSVKRGQNYITVVHDLDEKRLLFATPGRDHDTVEQFAVDLAAHGGKRTAIKHACIDMSAAYAKGITESLPKAQISYDRFHVVALANKAMDEVRTAEWATERQRVQDELSLSGILCARHSMSTRSMYAEQKDDEGGAGRSGGDATDSQGHH